MSHDHHTSELQGKRLVWAIVLNFTISIAEVIGGIFANSLSLLSDALHNLSDAFALFIAWVANKISQKKSNENKTFGYKRVEILAALLNAIILIVISIYLFFEAYSRLLNPEEIKGGIMLIVAFIGLGANVGAIFLIQKDARKNLNIKAAYLHLLGDTISSVAVIIGGVLIYYYDIYWIDPLITFLIGIYILKETWHILREAVDILMQSAPRNVNIRDIKDQLVKIQGIDNIHHIHVWNLNEKQTNFECHIDLNSDLKVSETSKIKEKVVKLLHDEFDIDHVTIQFEYGCCNDTDLIMH